METTARDRIGSRIHRIRKGHALGTFADIWVWIVLGVVALLTMVGGVFAARHLWYRGIRRTLVSLVGRREAIQAARRSLEDVARHLAGKDDEALEEFAADPDHEDRRTLTEVASRMKLAVDELDVVALPSPLVPVAEGLADAAFVIAEEAGRVGESTDSIEVFESLASMDLGRTSTVFDAADQRVKDACERYHLDEAAVYGGGLYI